MFLTEGQDESPTLTPLEELRNHAQDELDEVKGEAAEIALLVEQSQVEVNKLAQRYASVSAHLQQVQAQFDSLPRPDIRSAYDAALDAQQRLFVMRGQLEKLQGDLERLRHYQGFLEQAVQALSGDLPLGEGEGSGSSSGASQSIEMIIQAQESERLRLSRQMHDEPAQALSNFILQSEIALRLFDLDQSKAREELIALKASASATFQKVRDFIFELRPMMLDDLGLAPTIQRYLEALKAQTGLDIRLTTSGMEQRLESYQEVMVFRAIQELVGNALRHSQASEIQVSLDANDLQVRVAIADNGKGIDPERAPDGPGMGLKVIRDRVEMLGGSLLVDSLPGQGTRVVFQLPAARSAAFTKL